MIKNQDILDIKPSNRDILNTRPNNIDFIDTNFVYLDTRTVQKGQTMGLLLALTFPTAGTYTNAVRI